jgi:hypothetical protein
VLWTRTIRTAVGITPVHMSLEPAHFAGHSRRYIGLFGRLETLPRPHEPGEGEVQSTLLHTEDERSVYETSARAAVRYSGWAR